MLRRPIAFIGGMVAAGILAGVLAAWIVAMPHATGPVLHWVLASNGGPVGVARDTTVVKIRTDFWPACHPYDEDTGGAANSGWLVSDVSYSSTSVTITLHASSSFDISRCPGLYDYWGTPVEIHLREPLNGRALVVGSAG